MRPVRRARSVARRVLRARSRDTGDARPVLSVVVPVHDAVTELPRCLDSLAAQTLADLEVVVVDDGSADGSEVLVERFAARQDRVRVVRQAHRGVGAARNAGVAAATGTFLAFCDADDEVPPGAYQRLVDALRESGSDLAVGSVALQERGVYREPPWAQRSNDRRRLGVALAEVPEIVANLLPGSRVFRRSFWDETGLCFPEGDDHGDVVTMVRALLAARTLDVVPAVTYRWAWREDGRSLLQRDLREAARVRRRVEAVLEAADLVVADAPEQVERSFFTEILHTTVPDLVRAAVCRDDGYWAGLQDPLCRLMQHIPDRDLAQVPVEDRITAWLCARDERAATEEFLDYAVDNRNGFPVRVRDGHPHITLPFVDALATADAAMTRVAEVDLRYRTRLTALAWTGPGRLTVEGAAFVEYVGDDAGAREVTLLLRARATGEVVEVPARSLTTPTVNRWAGRAHEDHSAAGFEATVEVADLPRPDGGRAVYDVLVRLEVGGHVREAELQSRRGTGSPGLLEPCSTGSVAARPQWSAVRGLSIALEPAETLESPAHAGPARPSAPVRVGALAAEPDTLVLSGTAATPFSLALVGPRSRTSWLAVQPDADGFEARVSMLVDEWGLGPTSLPVDEYAVLARLADGSEVAVEVEPELWRALPWWVDAGTHLFHPMVADGRLSFRVTPGEGRADTSAFELRRLRDEHYPAARERPLLDAVLFETFGGKAAGDNPGPICTELARRGAGLDLVFAVRDRSVVLPEGARAVIRRSPEWFELLGRARYLVTNQQLPPFFRKREGQVNLQTWHGSPLKRIGHDRTHLDFDNWHHRRRLLESRDGWDLLLSQSPFCTGALRSAFRYDREVLEVGYPRNDLLRSPEADRVRRRTRAHLGIPEDARVVLYAPTWRDNLRAGHVWKKVLYLDAEAVVDQVPGSVVLVRGHYHTMGAAQVGDGDGRIVDVTRYPDIAHLYLAADALVTDYSSVFFDFALTDRPMFFLAPDLESYRDDNRGFYLDYHATVPGPVAESSEEVVAGLLGEDAHAEVRERFRAAYAPLDDGHASARVVDALLARGGRQR